MDSLKKIGILGYGKMGKEIFDLFHSKLPDSDFVVLLRHDINEEKEKVNKNLSKSLRRKKITEEVFEKMSGNFLFTDDLNNFSDCTLIIETVAENLEIKKQLFAELDKKVNDQCVFATNTSSLTVSEIFSLCSSERKTMGMHFFYPLKLSGYIEMNDCKDTETAEKAAEVTGKSLVNFSKNYCFYLNQYIFFCTAHAFLLSEKYGTGILKAMDVLNDLFPMHSLFGMADSIGLGLMTSGTTETSVRRIKPLLDSGREKMSSYLAAGCSPETGKFIEFITAQENGREEKDIDSENFKLDMLSAMLNEAVIAASENEGNITEALFDAVGLSENFSFYYKKYGYEKISESLDSLRTYTGISSYETADKKLYDTYFC
jgi:3-hydroxybutyryl-CoA dehydrogenase